MVPNPLFNDVELIQRIIKRDQGALTELEQCYRRLIFNMAFHVLQNESTVEEITQDVFFQVWRWPERWDPGKGRLTSWLLSVTRYTAIDRLRQENRQPSKSVHSLETIANVLGKRDVIDDANYDDGRLLRALIMTLGAEQRQAIELAFFNGMTHTEIAAHLNWPVGTVKSRIRLGLEKLKEGWVQATAHEPHEG